MTYIKAQRARAAAWKASTTSLPDDARAASPYVDKDGRAAGAPLPFCLPVARADHNLLPEVREPALALFRTLGIPWHAGIGRGPTNHLLSSQVQCVNALGQMVRDPSRIVQALGDLLGIDEVLQIEPGRYLTFEYIGPADYFGEAPNGRRVRGARCTSVDAAFLHRARDGVIELVLVEWKYTESYRARTPDPAKDAERRRRYGTALSAVDGPVRGDLLVFELLLDEPFYQLVRQQLLADALERHAAEGASRVRVVHVLPPENEQYQQSLTRPEHRALGSSVSQAWQRLLRRPDRFVSVDPEVFLDPEVTSHEYVARYAPDVVFDEAGLLAALGVGDAHGAEDALDWDGHVVLSPGGIELVIAGEGTGLEYPFRMRDLHALAHELAVN